ncbi:chemerin-like receptor 1 [Gastrophryne carolinensis]
MVKVKKNFEDYCFIVTEQMTKCFLDFYKMGETTFSFYYTDIITTETPLEDHVDEYIYETVKVVNIIVYSIIFVLGITGNGLVIWIAGFKMQKTVATIWFLNLALADFLFNICVPLQITEWALDYHWPFGELMCKIIFTAIFLNMSVSTSFLMIISIDRCATVMFPVWSKNHRTPKLAFSISLVIWTFCFILSSPYLVFFNIVHDPDSTAPYCIEVYSKDYQMDQIRYKAMLTTRFIVMFLVPFSVILICYSLITYRLRQSRSLSGSSRPFKVIVIIVLCFFCLWFPYHLWSFIESSDDSISPNVNFVVTHIIYALGFFNSCVNPMVYAFVGRDFKKSLNKSIPFLLENTFMEKNETDTTCEHNMVETEMETYN